MRKIRKHILYLIIALGGFSCISYEQFTIVNNTDSGLTVSAKVNKDIYGFVNEENIQKLTWVDTSRTFVVFPKDSLKLDFIARFRDIRFLLPKQLNLISEDKTLIVDENELNEFIINDSMRIITIENYFFKE